MQAVATHSHPLPAISSDLMLAPRAHGDAPARRRSADGARVVLRSEAGRHQPHHRPDSLDGARSRPARLLDGVPYTVSTPIFRPTGAPVPATANAAFVAQQFAQAGQPDNGVEIGLSADAAAAYRATAARGVTLLGPELHVSYRL